MHSPNNKDGPVPIADPCSACVAGDRGASAIVAGFEGDEFQLLSWSIVEFGRRLVAI